MIMPEEMNIRMMQKDKLCYVCSPYRENGERTVKLHEWYAKWLCDYIAINYGFTPIAPHLIYPSIWNESDPEGRQRGMECGEEILKKCDIVAVGRDYGISEGMKSEIELAKSLGKEVVIFEMHYFLVDGIHEAETRN